MTTYQVLQKLAASFGTAYFALIFVIALVYALLPSRREAFKHAARMPLAED